MATISNPRRALVGRFYVTMAAIFVAIAFSGFFMTYWMQVAQGTFTGSAMLHLHGLLFTAWTLFFLSQAWLMASGRYRNHRKWGLLGISLATAMVFIGLAVALQGLQARLDAGQGDPARAFSIIPMRDSPVWRTGHRGDRQSPAAGVAQAADARRQRGDIAGGDCSILFPRRCRQRSRNAAGNGPGSTG